MSDPGRSFLESVSLWDQSRLPVLSTSRRISPKVGLANSLQSLRVKRIHPHNVLLEKWEAIGWQMYRPVYFVLERARTPLMEGGQGPLLLCFVVQGNLKWYWNILSSTEAMPRGMDTIASVASVKYQAFMY